MKKLLLALSVMTLASGAWAGNTIVVKGNTMNLDTVFHAKVGPGTTQTQLRLTGTGGPLDVFYLTVDKSTPGVSIRAVSAGDKVAGTARTSSMAESKSKNGLIYFAGTNGDFYSTSGTATNGSSKVGTPTTSCTVDGQVIKTSNSNYQFSVDRDGVARVCRLNYYTGTATIGEKVTLFKGINVGAPNNGITIYTPKYWGSTNQTDYTDNCYEVTAKLVEGDKFECGTKFRLEVTSDPNTSGDTTVPADGFVIFARGNSTTGCNTGAKSFVKALKPGDIVEFDHIVLTPDNERIYPWNIVSGNPKTVGGGEVLDTESERNDAVDRHPRTGIGVSADGDKIVMMVIDGRTSSSIGVSTSALGAVMKYAGAAEAVNLDGGGSSTLYTRALGVRNHCSDGQERAVGNAIFAVVEAPDDKEVAELQFRDWVATSPYLGVYTPVVYAFNKYGVMIDSDFKDYTLSCPAELGEVSADGRSVNVTGDGTYALTASYGQAAPATVALTVDRSAKLEAKYPEVVIDKVREWKVELQSLVSGEYMPVAPDALKWSTSDADVATVTENGIVTGVGNGSCTISGELGDNHIEVTVKVEIPESTTMPIDLEGNPDNWSMSRTGITDNTMSLNANGGITADYTISSTRGTKLSFNNKINIWSHPDKIRIQINPFDATLSSLMLTLRAHNALRAVSHTFDNIVKNTENEFELSIADLFDTNDIGIYPIEFSSVAVTPTDAVKTVSHIEISRLDAVYPEGSTALKALAEASASGIVCIDGTIILPADTRSVEVYDTMGRLVKRGGAISTIQAPATRGIYLVRATTSDGAITAKISR